MQPSDHYHPISFDDLLDLRFKPNSKNFKACPKNSVFKHFDWVIWFPHSAKALRIKRPLPRTILCLAHPKSFRILNRLKHLINQATIVFAGCDTNLSRCLKELEPSIISKNRIFYEAKDIYHPSIKSFCMGFSRFYLEKAGIENIKQVIHQYENGHYTKSGVLAAWGKHWPGLDKKVEDRQKANTFLNNCSFISRQDLSPDVYWDKVARSEFQLCPEGKGIQAPKLAEAWLVGTVPIVTRNACFEDLKEMGYPIIILDKWDELTEDSLELWRNEIRKIDWNNVRQKLTRSHLLSLTTPNNNA